MEPLGVVARAPPGLAAHRTTNVAVGALERVAGLCRTVRTATPVRYSHPTDTRTAALPFVILAVGFAAYKLLVPGLPVSDPVIVRGGEREQPLSAAIADFDPDQIVTVIGKDGIPAIDEPRLVPAGEADLDDDDLVIGVELGGEARAYPIRVLSSHEIVNDSIAGKPFAVTW